MAEILGCVNAETEITAGIPAVISLFLVVLAASVAEGEEHEIEHCNEIRMPSKIQHMQIIVNNIMPV